MAGGLAIGLVVGLFVLKRDEPQEKMLLGQRLRGRDDGRYRILVVANETLSGRALRDEISQRGHSGEAQLKVVCPALNSKIKHWTNEEDAARAAAGARLQALLAGLRSEGFDADGDIGDDDPVQAMEDGLRRFPRGRGDHLDAPARALQLARARRRGARPRAAPTSRSRTWSSTSTARARARRRLLDGQVALHAGLLVARHGAVELVAARPSGWC